MDILTEASHEPVARFETEPWSYRLRLSPQGTWIAVSRSDPDTEDEGPSEFTVYANGSGRRSLRAIDLQFVDETRAAVLTSVPAGLAVGLLRLDDPMPASRQAVTDGLHTGRLAVAPDTGRWRVLGQAPNGPLIRFEGGFGQDGVTRTVWPTPAAAPRWSLNGMAGSGPGVLWVSLQYGYSRYGYAATLLASLSGGYPVRSSLFAGGPLAASLVARSEAQVTCLDPPVGGDEPVCFSSDGSRTNVYRVKLPAGQRQGVAAIQGSLWAGSFDHAGVIAVMWSGAPSLLRLGDRRLVRILPPAHSEIAEVVYHPGVVGVVAPASQQSIVTVYRLKEERPAARP